MPESAADNAKFVRAVLDAPLDDEPRIAYAEWLRGGGDTARAEFIRLQCTLSKCRTFPACRRKPECVCEGCRMKRRIAELLTAEAAQAWADAAGLAADGVVVPIEPFTDRASLPPGRLGLKWSRGFVAWVHSPTAVFWPAAGALFRRHPITRVTLTDTDLHTETEARSTGEKHYWLTAPDKKVWLGSSGGKDTPAESNAAAFVKWRADVISKHCVARGLKAAGLRR